MDLMSMEIVGGPQDGHQAPSLGFKGPVILLAVEPIHGDTEGDNQASLVVSAPVSRSTALDLLRRAIDSLDAEPGRAVQTSPD